MRETGRLSGTQASDREYSSQAAVLHDHLDRGLQLIAGNGLPDITEPVRQQLICFVELLAKWNKVYNLTAVRDTLQMIDRHLLDSLIMCRWLPEPDAARTTAVDVMDLGTGAGLPVLPLAIVRPDLQFLSVESNGKKTRFQQQPLLQLSIDNVSVANKWVEDISDQAQLVLSRAFTAPESFLEKARPLCAIGGCVGIMLGHAERLPTTLDNTYELVELVEVDVPGTDSARHVALCRRQCE